MNIKLHHISLTSRNPSVLKKFYINIFKFKVVHTFKSKKGQTYGYFLYISKGNFLEILKSNKIKKNDNKNFHFCFIVKKEFKKIYNICSKKNILFKKMLPIRGRTDNTLHFRIVDPENNICEIHLNDKQNKLYKYNN